MSISGTEMEPSNSNHKSLDRLVSQKALQMGSSFPCQICVAGFLCGVCLTTLFLAALTSFGTFAFGGISFSTLSIGMSTSNSSADINNMVTYGDCNTKPKEIGRTMYLKESGEHEIDHQVSLLYSAWSELLKKQLNGEGELLQSVGWRRSNLPKAPHLENCKLREQVNKHLDIQVENESFPPWTMWKGFLDIYSLSVTDEQLKYYRNQTMSEGAYPPWITGSDEENYPLTRKVQRDIWVNQHPLNCSDTNVRFLVADWEKLPGFGIGAQIAGMCGLLAIAINEKRVLVTNYYNRADHDGCRGVAESSPAAAGNISYDPLFHLNLNPHQPPLFRELFQSLPHGYSFSSAARGGSGSMFGGMEEKEAYDGGEGRHFDGVFEFSARLISLQAASSPFTPISFSGRAPSSPTYHPSEFSRSVLWSTLLYFHHLWFSGLLPGSMCRWIQKASMVEIQ